MITRVSLVPFDLGTPSYKKHKRNHKKYKYALEVKGYKKGKLGGMDKRLIGDNITRWVPKEYDDKRAIYLHSSGFGVLVDREEYNCAQLVNHESVARLLIDRKETHNKVLSKGGLWKKVDDIRDQVRDCNRGKGRRFRLCTNKEVNPYAFTYYEADDNLDKSWTDEGFQRGIIALCDPRKVGLGEEVGDSVLGEYEKNQLVKKVKNKIGRLGTYKPGTLGSPIRIDAPEEVTYYVGWAGLIVVGSYNDSELCVKPHELLEVLTQIIWVAAHKLQEWCESNLASHIPLGLSEVKGRVLPLLNQLKLQEAKISTEYYSDILQGLKRTSGLERVIKAAEEAMGHIEAQNRAILEQSIQVVLVTVALIQGAGLFLKFHLWSSPIWATCLVIAVSIFLILKSFNFIRRVKLWVQRIRRR